MSVKIIGTGSALPQKIVTNEDLAQLAYTSDEWIRERTGILFGAGAVLVERSEQPGILGFVQHSDGTKGEVLIASPRILTNFP